MAESETNDKQLTNNAVPTSMKQKDNHNEKYKDVYFIILIPSETKIDFKGLTYESKEKIKPSIVFNETIQKEDKTYLEEIVFKCKIKPRKNESNKSTKYSIGFIEEKLIYYITFFLKNNCFVYQPELKKENKYLTKILEEPIYQNIIPLYKKLNIFLKALQKENEIDKYEEKLYEDTIDLYKNKKQFSLLITLFLKIYKKNKGLCSKLIKIFYEINNKENHDRVNDLKNYVKSFNEIYSNCGDILKENNYNKIHFYGIIFCYLHYYDEINFPKVIEQFSDENADILYEILINYYSHFINPLKQSQKFYNRFIRYALENNKELKIFKRILKYIEDIETFLFVINENKEKILQEYKKLKYDPIKITSNLKLVKYKVNKTKKKVSISDTKKDIENSDKKSDISDEDDKEKFDEVRNLENESDKIKNLINEIIKFSEYENTLVIYLKSTFWINLIKEYDIPDWENIRNCHKLRNLYKEYNKLINYLYEGDIKNHKYDIHIDFIKKDINIYYERDEFAFILNKNIKEFFEKNKKHLPNVEILGIIKYYNPYLVLLMRVIKKNINIKIIEKHIFLII